MTICLQTLTVMGRSQPTSYGQSDPAKGNPCLPTGPGPVRVWGCVHVQVATLIRGSSHTSQSLGESYHKVTGQIPGGQVLLVPV